MVEPSPEPVAATEFRPFRLEGFWGEASQRVPRSGLEREVARVIDPGEAVETIHWGRNYLYRTELRTTDGPVPVVVKQFRNEGAKRRVERRLKGSKAARSWRAACAMVERGLPTAEPLLWIESAEVDGPSWYVCRHLEGTTELRYVARAVAEGDWREQYPELEPDAVYAASGRLLRRLHDAGLWHRDVTVGNILLRPAAGGPSASLVDLNRTRVRRRLSLSERCRDLCRLPIPEPRLESALLEAYWQGPPSSLARGLYRFYAKGFLFKLAFKKRFAGVRGFFKGLGPRRAHPHIPDAPADASARDKVVWDHLSDQPHQHAGRLEKLKVRVADLGGHLEDTVTLARRAPSVWRRYRALSARPRRGPVPWDGVGIALRPHPQAPEELLAAVDDLGARHVLLRLHPWQNEHDAEEELARALVERGLDVAFALPQNRELVRDPARWRSSVTTLAERFLPYGDHFQVGQAINRSKWGVWTSAEYVELARSASEILRAANPEVRILGPTVIDFELHQAVSVLNLKREGLHFDKVSCLLYVDRRGAPENPQLGFDTRAKALLLRAIAETARNAGPECWITEVNWPLNEGPHAPAGKSVAVSEEAAADFLVRYYLLTLTTGLIERVYWWQLIARGYGLATREDDGRLRRRPSFRAMATMESVLSGTQFEEALPAPDGAYLYRFSRPSGEEIVVGWCVEGRARATLPRAAAVVGGRDGQELEPRGPEVELASAPTYFTLERA